MKQCPLCRHTYQEANATHCLTDGTPLVQAFDTGGESQMAPTMWSGPVLSQSAPPAAHNNAVNNPPPVFQAEPQFSIPPAVNNSPESSNSKMLIILGVIGGGLILLIGFLGIVGFVVYKSSESKVYYTESNTTSSNSTTVKTPPSLNPYSGVLKDIVPYSVGSYSMWKDIEPYRLESPGKKEEVNAYYETPDKVRAVLSVKNFVSAEEANKDLLTGTKAIIEVWKPTEKGNAAQVVKNGKVVGTMVTIYATDPYGAPTEIISWTDGSLHSEVIIRKRGEAKKFVDSMPF